MRVLGNRSVFRSGIMQIMVREATRDDVDAAVETLQAAFVHYPFTRHTIAADGHTDRLGRSQRLFVERVGLPHGRVWVSDQLDAVSVWTTPASADAIGDVFAELAPELADIAGDRAEAAAAVEQALTPYRPSTPAWLLGTVGVRPERQGRGLGKAVIEAGLRAADGELQPAYLETSHAANLELYRTLGFQVTAEVELPEHGRTTWAMYREPTTRTR